MKKLFILTIMMIALSSQAKAFCSGAYPQHPIGYCGSGWTTVCQENYGAFANPRGQWMWVCMNRNGY